MGQMRRQSRQALQIVRGSKQIDMGQGGTHAARHRLIAQFPAPLAAAPEVAALRGYCPFLRE